MDPAEIVRHYPRLYHMAELGSWASVKRHGLLSTRALIDLFEVKEPLRSQILRQRRPECLELRHPEHGAAVVRDQIPLREGPLRGCLTDMTLEQWLDALNSRVFFWMDEPHLEILLGAGAYRDKAHDVLHVDTAALLERHAPRVTLSPINSGSTIYNPRPRGSTTFLPIADFPFDERRRARGKDAIIELAVDHSVPNIVDLLVRVERRRAGGTIEEVIWERP
ncbi:MAG: hypothetical protein WD844_17475 [Thermoleophilaceae bacterium]